MVIFSPFYYTDLLKLLPCPDLVCLGMWLQSRSLYKAPGCHCGWCSHPLFTCFLYCHLRFISRWDSWDSGMLLRGPWALPSADEHIEITSWSCTVPSLAFLCALIPPQLLCAAPMAVHTWAEGVLLQKPISEHDRGQILHLPLHVQGFQQCCLKTNCPLLPNFSVKLPLSPYYTEKMSLVYTHLSACWRLGG